MFTFFDRLWTGFSERGLQVTGAMTAQLRQGDVESDEPQR